ncbi:hypothetical protein ACP3V5_25445 [Vibrio maritimus]
MDSSNYIFLIQSRVGKALDIDFEKLVAMASSEVIVVGHGEVIKSLKKIPTYRFIKDTITINESYDETDIFNRVSSFIDRCKVTNFRFATINESRNILTQKLNRLFDVHSLDVDIFVCKDRMKDFLELNGIVKNLYENICKQRYLNEGKGYIKDVITRNPLPLFIKPVNMYASKLCSKIENEQSLIDFLDENIVESNIDFHVEPYNESPLFLCDSIIINGKVEYSQVCEYSTPCVNIYTSSCLGWICLPESNKAAKRVSKLAQEANEVMLKESSGVTHLEAFDDGKDSSFLEVAYRPNGIEPTPFYMKRAGIALREAHIALQINPNLEIRFNNEYYVACFILNYNQESGVFLRASLPEINSKHTIDWNCNVGEVVPSNSGYDQYAGTLMLWSSNYEELRKDFETIKAHGDFLIVSPKND